jgi:hypothetical protein
MHDDRIARLAGEFLDLDGDAVDDRAFHQVAMDAVGIAPAFHRSRSQGCSVRRCAFTSCERTGALPVRGPAGWSAGVSR